MKKILGIGAMMLLAGVLVAFVLPNTGSQQTRQAAKGVLDNVIAKDYDQAAEHLYFFDGATDQAPTISQEEGKAMWVERMDSMASSGVSLVNYENLQIEKDDGILRGYVDLTLNVDGEEIVRKDVGLMFAEPNGEWKLQDVEHLAEDAVEEWETALSGHVPLQIVQEK